MDEIPELVIVLGVTVFGWVLAAVSTLWADRHWPEVDDALLDKDE